MEDRLTDEESDAENVCTKPKTCLASEKPGHMHLPANIKSH
jgi:hypothetical protein